jgi:hypothetical protein
MRPFRILEEITMITARSALATLGLLILVAPSPALAQANTMSFFVSSVGSGRGANFGGLLGADKHCQTLAAAAGAGNRMWRAYLSQNGAAGHPSINAKDRIGTGPWYNAKGVRIASSVAELHSDMNNLTKETALTEKGEAVNGRGDSPNRHDILTGTQADGTAYPSNDSGNTTCGNWVRYFPGQGRATVGHHDRSGNDPKTGSSWNAAHVSQGCSQDELKAIGGDGLIYCFAAN